MNEIVNNLSGKVLSNEHLTEEIHRLTVEYTGKEEWTFTEGQFVMIGTAVDGRMVKRAYSISSLSSELPRIELIVKRIQEGIVSNYICDLKVGNDIFFDGPFGHFIWSKGKNKNKVLIAIGCGLAPLKSILLKQLQEPDLNIELYLGSKFLDQMPMFQYFEQLDKNNSNFVFYPCISRSKKGCRYFGRVNKVMMEQNIDFAHTDFYLCGTAEMIDGMKELIVKNGGSLDHVFNENIYPYVGQE